MWWVHSSIILKSHDVRPLAPPRLRFSSKTSTIPCPARSTSSSAAGSRPDGRLPSAWALAFSRRASRTSEADLLIAVAPLSTLRASSSHRGHWRACGKHHRLAAFRGSESSCRRACSSTRPTSRHVRWPALEARSPRRSRTASTSSRSPRGPRCIASEPAPRVRSPSPRDSPRWPRTPPEGRWRSATVSSSSLRTRILNLCRTTPRTRAMRFTPAPHPPSPGFALTDPARGWRRARTSEYCSFHEQARTLSKGLFEKHGRGSRHLQEKPFRRAPGGLPLEELIPIPQAEDRAGPSRAGDDRGGQPDLARRSSHLHTAEVAIYHRQDPVASAAGLAR